MADETSSAASEAEPKPPQIEQVSNVSGGINLDATGGQVNIAGDLVARDKVIHADEDIVEGDQIKAGTYIEHATFFGDKTNRNWVFAALGGTIVIIAVLVGLLSRLTTVPSSTPSTMPAVTATPTPQPTSTVPFTGTRSTMDVHPPVEGALIEYATAEPVPQKTLVPSSAVKITSFTLDSEASSYEKVQMSFAAAYPPAVTTYQDSFERFDQIRQGGCLPQAELDLPRIKEALQRFARQHGRDDALSYIATEAQVKTFARDWPDVAPRLVPRSAEWLELSVADREAYTTWLLDCVGIPYPAFHVTVQNTSDQEQVITGIVYRVHKTGQVMGGEGGALSPQVTYVHSIVWQAGDQEVALEHPFAVPPKRSASFNLQLMPSTGGAGMCWLMTIYLVIDGGPDAVASDEFQLIMSNLDSSHR